MVLVESLACGTPIVTTTQGAPQELVDPGVTGELCAPGDADDLAAALLRGLALAGRPGTVDACRGSARSLRLGRGPGAAVRRAVRGLMARVLVTGAGGYVGSGLVADPAGGRLGRASRWDASRSRTWTSSRWWPTWTRTPMRRERACAGVDAVVHLAGENEVVAARASRGGPGRDRAGHRAAGRGPRAGRGAAPGLHVHGPRLRRADGRRRHADRGHAPRAACPLRHRAAGLRAPGVGAATSRRSRCG